MSIFPTKILLATDGSEEAILAAHIAADLANKTDSELHIVHASPRITPHRPGYYVGPEVIEGAAERERKLLDHEAHTLLDAQVEQVRTAGGSTAQTHLRIGRIDEEIIAAAEGLGVALIVVGSRGQGGMRRALMGSVSDSVVRHAHCPVMVVRGEPSMFPMRILLATDGSEEANLASSTAADLAEKTNSELYIVTVGEDPYLATDYTLHFPEAAERHRQELREEVQAMLDGQVERVQEAGGKVTQTHLKVGRADDEIVSLAKELSVSLIVMGSRGQGGIRRALMGSVSDGVVRHAHCPVLVVRPEK
ncbi:MAG TPA: universal stress protein [Rubrobacter sp.]|nr:universal stress protein [Rubrobacter sp.]